MFIRSGRASRGGSIHVELENDLADAAVVEVEDDRLVGSGFGAAGPGEAIVVLVVGLTEELEEAVAGRADGGCLEAEVAVAPDGHLLEKVVALCGPDGGGE